MEHERKDSSRITTPHHAVAAARREEWRALRPMLMPLAMFIICVGLLYWLSAYVFPSIGATPTPIARADAVLKRLRADRREAAGTRVYCFGSSVVREGIDAAPINERLGREGLDSLRFLNLGMAHSDPVQAWLYSFDASRARPAAVVIGLRLIELGTAVLTPEAYLRYAAINDLPENAPEHDSVLTRMGRRRHLLEYPLPKVHWDNRRYLADTANEWLGRGLRGDLKISRYIENFDDPWTHTTDLPPAMIAEQTRYHMGLAAGTLFSAESANIAALEVCAELYRKQKILFILVLTPVHPNLTPMNDMFLNAAEAWLRDGKVRGNFVVLDHRTILSDPTDWSDTIHPNHRGRVVWSPRLAEDLSRELKKRKGD